MVWSDRISESELQTVVCKEVEESVSLKRSLYGGRELLSELGSWLSSFIYECERRKRVCKWVRVWAFIYTWKMIILR